MPDASAPPPHQSSAPSGCGGASASTSGSGKTTTPAPCLLSSARAFWSLWRATQGGAERASSPCGAASASAGPAAAARARAARATAADAADGARPSRPTLRAHSAAEQQQQQQPNAKTNAAAAAAAAASASATAADLEERYGTPTSHTSLGRAEVEHLVDDALESSAPVRYLLDSLSRGGCGVGRAFFHVARCDGDVHGGFSTEFGVVLCHNRLQHAREVELALAHELVHAYDFCRARDLDLANCRHHACTEVRAAALSGDCGFAQELLRGNLSESLVGQYRRCVRRRAAMSVAMNPHCAGPGEAEAAVAAVLPQCFRDTDPWPRIPALG